MLYGVGKIGKEAFQYVGEEYVEAFCDCKADEKKLFCGKTVISFKELQECHEKYVLMITASETNSQQMISLCKRAGINNFLLFNNLKKYNIKEYGIERLLYKVSVSADYKDAIIEILQELLYLKEIRFHLNAEKSLGYRENIKKGKQELIYRLCADENYHFVCIGDNKSKVGLCKHEYGKFIHEWNTVVSESIEDAAGQLLRDFCEWKYGLVRLIDRAYIYIGKNPFEIIDIEILCIDENDQIHNWGNREMNPFELGGLSGDGIVQMDELQHAIRKVAKKVEFYLVDAFEVAHFKPVYELLREKCIYAVFIAENAKFNTTGSWFDQERAVSYLNSQNLEYKEMADCMADIAFSTQAVRVLKKYSLDTTRIIQQYGCSLLRKSFGWSLEGSEGYDYKFSNGEWDRKLNFHYMKPDQVFNIGYPKYYGFVRGSSDTDALRRELGINTCKKIITYLPTWDEYSSISEFYNQLKQLKKEFYIITKPHHCTVKGNGQPDHMQKIYDFSDLVLDPDYCLDKFSYLGDLMLVDAKSGAALETVFLNPGLKTLWLTLAENYQEYFWDEIDKMAKVVKPTDDLEGIVKQYIHADLNLEYRKEHIFEYFSDKGREELWDVLEKILAKRK